MRFQDLFKKTSTSKPDSDSVSNTATETEKKFEMPSTDRLGIGTGWSIPAIKSSLPFIEMYTRCESKEKMAQFVDKLVIAYLSGYIDFTGALYYENKRYPLPDCYNFYSLYLLFKKYASELNGLLDYAVQTNPHPKDIMRTMRLSDHIREEMAKCLRDRVETEYYADPFFFYTLLSDRLQLFNGKESSSPNEDVKVITKNEEEITEGKDPNMLFSLAHAYLLGIGLERDYEKALKLDLKAAEMGNDEAMLELGIIYMNGMGVQKNIQTAISWWEKAASHGNGPAMFNLGIMYSKGDAGVERNPEKGLRLIFKAADKGVGEAMYQLGWAYNTGNAVEKNYAKAMEWYLKAVDCNQINAMLNIGVMYLQGEGVEQDSVKAIEWLEKAANCGHGGAMYNLGLIYEKGLGSVTVDMLKAKQWYDKAKKAGFYL